MTRRRGLGRFAVLLALLAVFAAMGLAQQSAVPAQSSDSAVLRPPVARYQIGKPVGALDLDLSPQQELTAPGASAAATLTLQPRVDTASFRVAFAATGVVSVSGGATRTLGAARAQQDLTTTVSYTAAGAGTGELRVTVEALGSAGQVLAGRVGIIYVRATADAVLHGTSGHLVLEVRALDRARTAGQLTEAEYEAAMERALGGGARQSTGPSGRANSIGVSGQILWTDSAGGTHPVRFAPVEIHDTGAGANPIATVATNATGNYSISIPTGPPSRNIFIRVLAQGTGFRIILPGGAVHRIDSTPQTIADGASGVINLTANNTADNNTAFSVHDALVTINQYVTDVRGSGLASIDIVFPTTESTSLYRSSEGRIHLLQLDRFDWDVIHHEYGHYVMDMLDIENGPGGPHSSSDNLGEPPNTKDHGIRLAWAEGWPTYFGTVAQVLLNTAAFNIPNVGDTRYQDTEDSTLNYAIESQNGGNSLGEDNELSVTVIMWDLHDAVNDTGDTDVAIGHTALWNLLDAANPTTLSAAYQAIVNGRPAREVAQIGCIMTTHNVAPELTAPANGGFAGTAPPTFTWTANGGGPSNRNNAFIVEFYNGAFTTLLLSSAEQTGTSFTPTQPQWDTVRGGAGATVNWLVRARQTNAPATGPYRSCSSELEIDTVPPTTTATPNPAANAAGWNNTNVTVNLSATDNAGGSGVREIVWTLTGAQTDTVTVAGSSATVTVSAEGTTTLTYFARDNAGNAETGKTLTVKIDKTPPALSQTATTADGQPYPEGKWTNQNVTVTLSCTDPLSGLASMTASGAASGTATVSPLSVTVTTEAGNQFVQGACTDVAGNTSQDEFGPINIDKTPPEVYFRFDPTTKGIAVFCYEPTTGPAGPSGCASAAPLPVIASSPMSGGATQRLYRALDLAGNSATATIVVTPTATHVAARYIRIQYTGQPATTPLTNSAQFSYTPHNAPPYTKLEQLLDTITPTAPATPAAANQTKAVWTGGPSTTITPVKPAAPAYTVGGCAAPGLLLHQRTNKGAVQTFVPTCP